MDKLNWIDSHCHLVDARFEGKLTEILAHSRDAGIGFHMMAGVDPDDWRRQVLLARTSPENLGMSFGLHPYFIAEHDEEECEAALDLLASELSQTMNQKNLRLLALGETGLDFRPQIMKDSRERQIAFFEHQIELAQVMNLPLVLHLVQAFPEALRVLDFFGPHPRGGMVHAFNGSSEMADQFVRRGFLISVGGAVTYDKNRKLQNAVRDLPLENLLLETDSPDQTPENRRPGLNVPENLMEVALKVGALRDITASEVLDISAANFRRVFLRERRA